MPKIIGIDLGPTNSVAAIVEANKIYVRKSKNLKEFLISLEKFALRQKIKDKLLIHSHLLVDSLLNNVAYSLCAGNFKNPFKINLFSHSIIRIN